MEVLDGYFYTEDHEWIKKENGTVKEGITDYAQSELQDIVYVELPEVGLEVQQGDPVATIEAVKTVSDLFAPVSGEIVAVNNELEDKPELINSEPYEGGWIVEIKLSEPDELETLMEPADYRKIIEEE